MKLGKWIVRRLAGAMARRFDAAAEAIELDLLLPWYVYPAGTLGAELRKASA